MRKDQFSGISIISQLENMYILWLMEKSIVWYIILLSSLTVFSENYCGISHDETTKYLCFSFIFSRTTSLSHHFHGKIVHTPYIIYTLSYNLLKPEKVPFSSSISRTTWLCMMYCNHMCSCFSWYRHNPLLPALSYTFVSRLFYSVHELSPITYRDPAFVLVVFFHIISQLL